MKTKNNFQDFIAKIEGKLISKNSESILHSIQTETSVFGGKNRSCTNKDENCNKSKNRNCTNYNKDGCLESTNKGAGGCTTGTSSKK